MTRERVLMVGAAGTACWIVGLLFATHDALVAWLVCWLGIGAIPIGSLGVLMLVALIPGTWRHFYGRSLAFGASLMPLAAIAAIPMLVGVAIIYPWTAAGATSGYAPFKAAWLSTGFFVGRTIGYLLMLSLISWFLLSAEPRSRPSIAAFCIILYALVGSFIGIDFGETAHPDFHSSIWGLLSLTNQWLAGISFAILLSLWSNPGKPPLAAAGVLVTAILMWSYMHAMQYIVIWSGDIPFEARWYIERGHDASALTAWLLYGLQGLACFAVLLSPKVRGSRAAMMAIAALTLLMRPVEQAWLILPGMKGIDWLVTPLMLAAAAAMVGLGWLGAQMLRRPEGTWSEAEWAGNPRSV